MEVNLPQGFAVSALPPAQHLRLRTSNGLERVHQELKRRTCVAGLFPNEASLLRLVTALLNEISDEWQTAKAPSPPLEKRPGERRPHALNPTESTGPAAYNPSPRKRGEGNAW